MNSDVSLNSVRQFRRFVDRVNALSCIRFLIIAELGIKAVKVLFIGAVLYIKRNERVEVPLKLFLEVYACLNVLKGIAFYLKNRSFFRIARIPDYEESGDITIANNFLEAMQLFWYIVGFHWLQECPECRFRNPLVYYTCAFWVGFGFFAFLAPLLAIVALLLIVSYIRPKLKVIKYESPSDLPDNNHTCTICFDEYRAGSAVKFLPCDHHFHSECIDEWFNVKDSCPLCKKHVNLLYDLVETAEPGI